MHISQQQTYCHLPPGLLPWTKSQSSQSAFVDGLGGAAPKRLRAAWVTLWPHLGALQQSQLCKMQAPQPRCSGLITRPPTAPNVVAPVGPSGPSHIPAPCWRSGLLHWWVENKPPDQMRWGPRGIWHISRFPKNTDVHYVTEITEVFEIHISILIIQGRILRVFLIIL